MQEEKRRRGRPATGRHRTENLALRLTPKEKDFIKSKAKEHSLSLADYFLMLAKKSKKGGNERKRKSSAAQPFSRVFRCDLWYNKGVKKRSTFPAYAGVIYTKHVMG